MRIKNAQSRLQCQAAIPHTIQQVLDTKQELKQMYDSFISKEKSLQDMDTKIQFYLGKLKDVFAQDKAITVEVIIFILQFLFFKKQYEVLLNALRGDLHILVRVLYSEHFSLDHADDIVMILIHVLFGKFFHLGEEATCLHFIKVT